MSKASIYRKTLTVVGAGLMAAGMARASQLSGDAKAAIPNDVQQLIVVDYRAMQGSPAAMNLKEKIMPPELRRLETALKSSGMKLDRDTDTLAFAAFRTGGGASDTHTVALRRASSRPPASWQRSPSRR